MGPDQKASSEASWSGSTVFSKKNIKKYGLNRTRIKILPCHMIKDKYKHQIWVHTCTVTKPCVEWPLKDRQDKDLNDKMVA